jgi:ketosteroid isomerase-like protein
MSLSFSRDTARVISQLNVDKTREFIAAYNNRDFAAAVKDFDPQVEWVLPALQRSDSCIGPDEVMGLWDEIDETMEELQLRPQEFRDAGDLVAVKLRHYGKGKGSGLVIDEELYHQVSTFRDGVMVRIEYFTSWDEALEAAGLRD